VSHSASCKFILEIVRFYVVESVSQSILYYLHVQENVHSISIDSSTTYCVLLFCHIQYVSINRASHSF